MIQSEKQLEDYICEHQSGFIYSLQETLAEKDIKFVGRQIKIGKDNIADLVYYYDLKNNEIDETVRTFIVVELKYRELTTKDLSQIARYMSVLKEKIERENNNYIYDVIGIFVSFGLDENMQEIDICEMCQNVYFMQIKDVLHFEREIWSHKDEYINSIELDNRLLELMD